MMFASLFFLVCMQIILICTSPLHAQDKLLANPAEKYVVAPGGVDMRTGQYIYENVDLSIGSEVTGLSLKRLSPNYTGEHINPFKNFSHNFDIMLMEARVGIWSGDQVGLDYRIFVHIGGRTMTFEALHNMLSFEYKGDGPTALMTYSNGAPSSASVTYEVRTPDGIQLRFRPMGSYDCANTTWGAAPMRCAYISEMIEPDGTKTTFDYDYNSSLGNHRARLRRVTSSRGYAILLEGGGSQVTKVCAMNLAFSDVPLNGLCPSGQPTAYYTYDGTDRPWLTSYVSPSGDTWSWTYTETNGGVMMGFINPGLSGPWLSNFIVKQMDEAGAMQDIVFSQIFADGRNYSYSYDRAPYTNARPNPPIAGGVFNSSHGDSVGVHFDYRILPGTEPGLCFQLPCAPDYVDSYLNRTYQQTPGPVSITDALNRTTTFDYCDPVPMAALPPIFTERCYVVALQSFVDPEGVRTELKYDGSRNITEVRRKSKPGSGLPDIVTSATYNCSVAINCAKPVTMTDARGSITEFSYDNTHGGLLMEMGPAPAPGSARPLKLRTYTQRYAFILSGGSLVPADAATWLPQSETVCQTFAGSNAPTCDWNAPYSVTHYDYGPDGTANNLLLRGVTVTADGQTRRTCYTYDALGRQTSATPPGAEMASCP